LAEHLGNLGLLLAAASEAKMPDLEFPKLDRFADDFSVAFSESYQATSAEQAYVTRVNTLLGRLAAADTTSIPEVREELERVRSECARELFKRAQKFSAEPRGPNRDQIAARESEASHQAEGVYADRWSRVLEIPFVVRTIPPEPKRPIHDIEIRTRDVPIPEDKRKFKVEIDSSTTVIKTVLSDRRSWWWWWRRSTPDPQVEDAKRRKDEYLFALAGIAQVGLMNLDKTQTPFAGLALQGLQGEFVAREAGIVKNGYVTRLGIAALITVVLGAVGYVVSGLLPDSWIPHRFREFFLLGCGTAVGTWLSFSIRRVTLSFTDLATLEEDRLNPSLRVVFMAALTTVMGLLLWTHAVVIQIGEFKSDFAHNGVFALLIGALGGIAERSLTTAVSKRAQEFVAALGITGRG
jgi:hypothetical protein